MVKVKKKKNRKLRRQIRKTVGALLMVSAITVAAIPVQDVSADEEYDDYVDYDEEIMLTAGGLDDGTDVKVKVLNQGAGGWENGNVAWRSEVPYVQDSDTIYTDYNGRYQFAFVPNATGEYVAVILGASIGQLDNYTLTIDSYVDAYKKYAANTSDLNSLCAVTKSDQFLYYYKDVVQMQDGYTVYTVPSLPSVPDIVDNGTNPNLRPDENGKLFYWNSETDSEGNAITVPYEAVPKTVPELTPCLRGEYGVWGPREGETATQKTLYYLKNNDPNQPVESRPDDGTNGRLYHADVAYIGRQYIELENGEWKIKGDVTKDNPERGVFAGNGNIRTLNIPSSLLGIGDYAFFKCGYLSDVTLGNGLSTIGNGAFAFCNNMRTCDLDIGSRSLAVIGKEAFLGCTSLTNIRIPLSVDAIGDYCFRNCTNLRDVDMSGGLDKENYSDRLQMQLTTIGIKAFEGCSTLDKLIFPEGCTEKLPINYFKGCDQLRFISTLDRTGTFDIIDGDTADGGTDAADKDHTSCEISKFMEDKPQFYFEGYENSAIQATAHLHTVAFSYIDTLTGNIANRFEKMVNCSENPSHSSKYVVNKDNQLIDMDIDEDCGEINIPSSIGPYSILEIAQRGFENNCTIKRIVIPSSIVKIGERAFGGCHNLENVIFQSPVNSSLVIEEGAFDTQDVQLSSPGVNTCTFCSTSLKDTPVLNFVADICQENSGENTAPFLFAMEPGNNVNNNLQTANTYITFYSGWPTNLTVQYNHEKDLNELIKYPRLDDLSTYAQGSYPDMTTERAETAKKAAEAYKTNGNTAGLTPEQIGVIDSAVNIVLPNGIESIKTGLFSGVDSENDPIAGESVNEDVKSITMHSVKELEPYSFAACSNLESAFANGLEDIGDYAFIRCSKLVNADMGKDVVSMGMRPFAKCNELQNVGFTDNPNFMCDNAIIFGMRDGAKDSIIECLEARGQIDRRVGPDELAGVSSIAEEAFKDCDGVGTINLSKTVVTEIPRECFSQTDNVGEVYMPETLVSIGKGAFWNSKVFYVDLPDGITFIEPDAFANVAVDSKGEIILDDKGNPTIETRTEKIQFHCAENNKAANTYADRYDYIKADPYVPEIRYKVTFWDNYEDQTNPQQIGEDQMVLSGEDAIPPSEDEIPVHEGVTFTGWNRPYTNISGATEIFAQYGDAIYTVQFADYDGKPLGDPQYIEAGKSATPPEPPVHEGATFKGWSPDYRDVNSDRTCIAQYDFGADANLHTVTFYTYDGQVHAKMPVLNGGTVYPPSAPAREGYTFIGWVPATGFENITEDKSFTASYDRAGSSGVNPSANPSGGGNGGNNGGSGATPTPDKKSKSSATPTPTATPTPEVRKYTVSVSGGSGSGSYAAGQIVSINAYFMGEGQVFDKWTSSTAGVGFANPNASSTTFTMPAANVAVTATYKTGGSGSATTNASGGGNGGGGTTGTVNQNNGTTVDVTKPGFSNTNLAGATVSGATDNFVVKVTEDQIATDAATSALQARYGSLDRIKYLPMDISLYDSTGRTKIADTSGISVNLTLPLPDDLVQYAGNNRVAAISGGQLEDLNTRFTTVGGVPCVNFTATHFSPYVIYVDTANLTEATIDATPKTGDPIHPKWFLSLGMACLALILFFKKDRAVVVKKKRVA